MMLYQEPAAGYPPTFSTTLCPGRWLTSRNTHHLTLVHRGLRIRAVCESHIHFSQWIIPDGDAKRPLLIRIHDFHTVDVQRICARNPRPKHCHRYGNILWGPSTDP